MVQPTGEITVPVNTTATTCVKAIADPGGIDVTESVQWQTGTAGVVTVYDQSEDPMCVLAGATPNTTTLFATYTSTTGTITSNSVTVNVTQ